MQISIANVLLPEEIVRVRHVLTAAEFGDGRETAGWAAARVKHNEQARIDVTLEDLQAELTARLGANQVFDLSVRPKRFLKVRFSRYRQGHAYGRHVDNAIMDGGRTDVSFTLFLTDPDTYDGGELVLETAAGEDAIKLPAGSVLAYPSTTLHRVAEVTRGERLVMVGWVRSYVRDQAQRELLFDLETARRSLFDKSGNSAEFNLLSKVSANLVRMWSDD